MKDRSILMLSSGNFLSAASDVPETFALEQHANLAIAVPHPRDRQFPHALT